jgi:hypothetical protein
MFENIYFIPYGSLRYFLSIIEPGKSNLIIIQDTPHLRQFVSEALPDETLIASPRIDSRRIPVNSKNRFLQRMLDILIFRFQIPEPLKNISPQAKVFLFQEVGYLSFFILCKYLQKKGAIVNFVDFGNPVNHKHKVSRNNLPGSLRVELWFLQLLSGLRLAWFEAPYKKKLKMIGLSNHLEPMKVSPMPWNEISRKYSLRFGIDTKKAVLFIDCTLQTIIGIDVKRSQQNVVDFISHFIDKGVVVHVKGHQGEQLNSFSGTALEHKVQILPTYYPVELIMDYYQEVYGIISVSLSNPIKGKKFSLANLLVFKPEERVVDFNRAYKAACGKEIGNISLVDHPCPLNQD